MIQSRADYHNYVRADIAAYGLKRLSLRTWLQADHIRFLLRLRRIEYLANCQPWRLFSRALLVAVNHRLAVRLGFTIPPNTFGPGLCIAHRGTVIVNPAVHVGSGCKLHADTNIGDYNGTPVIGNDVYIGPGAKIFGAITIGDNVAIGANAVVNRSFGSNCTIGGIPAHVLSDTGARERGLFNRDK
ncbi:MAG: serine acetyltransferase [Bacteroidales bacterium]|nr:serine acetyltransferase [Bacteroidales bacterium]